MGRPVPSRLALGLLALGLLPAMLATLVPLASTLMWIIDGVVITLVLVDFALSPRVTALRVERLVEPVLSSGVPHLVRLKLELAPGRAAPVRGELRDVIPPGPSVDGARARFRLSSHHVHEYRLTCPTRGDLAFTGLWFRLKGPLGLCARQQWLPLAQTIKIFPDLTALTRDALALARANDDTSRRLVRQRSDGREFESLREYRAGDDRRSIDWKASARRGKAIVRVHQPERNQQVLLMIDCGRHMSGVVAGRRKLDHAVDAALRLARVSLDQGDQVGVVAFGTTVKAHLPARRGAEQLRAIAQALYRIDASLEESDVGAALDLAFARQTRRSLVVFLTDVLDAESSAPLVGRALRLVPRHLPLIASLQDAELHALATQVPTNRDDAWQRFAAQRLEAEALATIARLRDSGARVVRAPPARFGAAAVSAYLDLKNRGLL